MHDDLFDPLSQDWLRDKHSFYRVMREECPVYWSNRHQAFVLTRHEDVMDALRDSSTFSSARGNLVIESEHRFGRTLGASDNPTHDQLKKIVGPAYSKPCVEEAVKSVGVTIGGQMSGQTLWEASQFTATLLNIPADKRTIANLILQIQRESRQSVVAHGSEWAYEEFKRIVMEAGAPKGPGIYAQFHAFGKKHMSLMTGPTLSGTTSLAGALQFLLLDLANNPDQYQDLRANRALIPQAIAESIRHSSSTGRFSRTLTTDVGLAGVYMTAGSRVILCLDAANRDPAVFGEPDRFNIRRTDLSASLGYGHGIHSCIALYLSNAFLAKYLHLFLHAVDGFCAKDPNPGRILMVSGNFDLLDSLEIETD